MRKREQNKLNKTSAHHDYNAQQTGEKGITLVSLVVTIIVLLILAGVGINLAINSDGLFAKANEATEEWNTAVGQEETTINNLVDTLEEFSPSLKPMVTKWNIAAGDTISICLYSPEDLIGGNELSNNTDITIDWGDGTKEHYTSSNLQYDQDGSGYITHTYTTANSSNIVIIEGRCNAIATQDSQLTSIEQWGYTETYTYIFYQCTNLSSIASPEKYTFKNVTAFLFTFAGCTGLTNIPDSMFANCRNDTLFMNVFIGCTGLTSIGDYAFANCSDGTMFIEIFKDCTNITTIGAHAFDGCSGVTSFDGMLPDYSKITSIGDYAFANCTSVTNFDGLFANCTNLTSIGTHTFEGCANVTSFAGTFAGCTGITSIGDYAFANCSAVTNFDGTFYGCENLTIIGAHAFDGCSSVTSFSSLFKQPTSLGTKMNDTYTVEKCIVATKEYEVMPVAAAPSAYNINITSIGDYAFANCTSVTSFSFAFHGNTNLTSIGEYAFANCTSVTSFLNAFYGCENLTTIGDYAFANCSAVTSFDGTFQWCTNLQAIPEHLFENTPNVTSFAKTFYYCSSLTGNPIPLWERVPDGANNGYEGIPDGDQCYSYCEGITGYDDGTIPTYWRLTR